MRLLKPCFTGWILGWIIASFVGERAEGAASKSLPAAAVRVVDYAKDIQPILSRNCYECHGALKQEAGFRLDRKESALKGGDYGIAIVVGKSADSLLIHAVSDATDKIVRMPKKGPALSAEQIGLLRAWIDQGTQWPETGLDQGIAGEKHWAFKAPVKGKPPAVKGSKWVRGDLDRFIQARLEKEGLRPSPEADRITLIRRVYLDLIGLPPTSEQVDAYLADKSSEAYRKVVDQLLESPHHGERWARHWLDAARYADSDGFEKDKPRFIWAYRDWVVNAINRDLPYDKFVIEQLAGDLLPDSTEEQKVATGFLRNSMVNEEGGVDPEQFRTDGLFDRMDAIGKSVLGITIQCAQCHNHKYDPLSQEEYYRLFSFLNNDHESSRIYYPPSTQQKVADLSRQMRDLEEGLRHVTPDWQQRMNVWEDSIKSDQPSWKVLRAEHHGEKGERFYDYVDGSIRASSYAPTYWTAEFWSTNHAATIGAFRFEQLNDPNLPSGGPGRSIKGMAALSEFRVELEDLLTTNKVKMKFVNATADFSNAEKPLEAEFDDRKERPRPYGPIQFAIDGKPDTAWGIDAGPGRRNAPRKAVFAAEKPVTFTNDFRVRVYLEQNHGGYNSDDNQNHNLGRFRISQTESTKVVADPLPANVREIIAIAREQRSPAQVATVFTYWRTTVPQFKDVNAKIEALWKEWPEGTSTMTLAARRGAMPGDEVRTTRLFRRGDWLKPANEVTFGTPAFLHPLPAQADGSRLTFAKWLTDKKSPTTARVAVNRMWQQLFGTGLLETSEDFGKQSPPPFHPELLDWLACQLMEEGWSMKKMLRTMVNSATYRQGSRVTPALLEKDPANRLLARGARFRVEGEIVRDLALASSGLLNPALGGRGVYPPAPEFLFLPPASYGPKVWTEEKGPERYRRSLYVFKFRSVPYPVLMNFDAPNGDFSCVRRGRSNTPLQALTTLNETIFMECAQHMAVQVLTHGGSTDEDRINYAFRRVLSRLPNGFERGELKALLKRQSQRIADGWINPVELSTGKNVAPKLPPGTTPTQLAAYTVVSRALLNLDEAITKE